jgi:hypothetical protein
MPNSIAAVTFNIALWAQVVGGAWSPDREQLRAMQERLPAAVASMSERDDRKPIADARYTVQYQGRIENGRRVIFVFASCRAPYADPHRAFLFAIDGGACYVSGNYDPFGRHYEGLAFNGDG